MSGATSAIDRALVAVLTADATLAGLMPDGVFFDDAPDTATAAVIISVDSSRDEEMYGEDPAWEEIFYRVEALELAVSGATASQAGDRIRAILDGQRFPIEGYVLMDAKRVRPIRRSNPDDTDRSRRWHRRGGMYRVWAHVE